MKMFRGESKGELNFDYYR